MFSRVSAIQAPMMFRMFSRGIRANKLFMNGFALRQVSKV